MCNLIFFSRQIVFESLLDFVVRGLVVEEILLFLLKDFSIGAHHFEVGVLSDTGTLFVRQKLVNLSMLQIVESDIRCGVVGEGERIQLAATGLTVLEGGN